MSKPDEKIAAISELNIAPIAISYEWESCDILKTLELYESQYTKYTKKPGEDLNSIITGILQPKGQVHIEFCAPIQRAELSAFSRLTNNEYHKAVARLIDTRINTNYRSIPTTILPTTCGSATKPTATYIPSRNMMRLSSASIRLRNTRLAI